MPGLDPAIDVFLAVIMPSVDARDKRGHDGGESFAQTSASSFSMHFAEPCGSVAARRIPAGCRAKLSFEPFALPIKREAERRNSRARNAAPVGPSCDRTCPSSGRELPAHNADRRAFRRSTAAFSLDLGTAFWKRTGAPIHERP